jgi:hypothetical protein
MIDYKFIYKRINMTSQLIMDSVTNHLEIDISFILPFLKIIASS